jgi:uncharacterized protein involved in tolerance to divalent cations
LVNCNSINEARKIGNKILDQRFAACFDVFERNLTSYFWPPKSGKKEIGKGALLIFETTLSKYKKIKSEVGKIHSDKLPLIGYTEIKGTDIKYQKWLKGEIK